MDYDYYEAELYAEDPELFREYAQAGIFDTDPMTGPHPRDYE